MKFLPKALCALLLIIGSVVAPQPAAGGQDAEPVESDDGIDVKLTKFPKGGFGQAVHDLPTYEQVYGPRKLRRKRAPLVDVDWRKLSNCPSLKKIWNQGQCQTCWAVVAASLLSDYFCLAGLGKDYISATQIAACTYPAAHPHLPEEICNMGTGNVGDAFLMAKQDGVVTGGVYGSNKGCLPYSVSGMQDPSTVRFDCNHQCFNRKWSFARETKTIYNAFRLVNPSVLDMKTILSEHGPVAALMTIHTDFKDWDFSKKPVYVNDPVTHPPVPAANEAAHWVRIVGYKGNEYWIVANSWGKDWGQDGYFKIQMNSNMVGIESLIMAPVISNNRDPNPCLTSDFCGNTPIDQVISADPKDPKAPFYLFQAFGNKDCVQMVKQDSATIGSGKLVTVGPAVPKNWVFDGAPAGSIVRYKLEELGNQADSKVNIWLFGAAGPGTRCQRISDTKFFCDPDQNHPLVPDAIFSRSMYYDDKNSLVTWSYHSAFPTVLSQSLCGPSCAGKQDSKIDTLLTSRVPGGVSALYQLNAQKLGVFGKNAAGVALSSVLSLQDLKLSPDPPAAGKSIITCS